MIPNIPLSGELLHEIKSAIEDIKIDKRIFLQQNFLLRSEVLDDIECHMIDRLAAFTKNAVAPEDLHKLIQTAEELKNQLEEVNTKMFQLIRKKITQEHYRGERLMHLIDEYLGHQLDSILRQNNTGYDHLDVFLNGLLTDQHLPAETKVREPGMVYYQKTPARFVFELIRKAAWRSGDVFYDLGSGTGQVVMLVNLLGSVISKGVEYEPAFCEYAKARATDLNLFDVYFTNGDARYADYSLGTVFFMYTPFEGKMLEEVLLKLHTEAKTRKIRIFTYGSCTTTIACQSWLRPKDAIQNDSTALTAWESI